MKPRELTTDEVREQFLNHCRIMVRYWADPKRRDAATVEQCVEGVVFSVLAAIDGCAADLPAFSLVPAPHADDKKYHKANGSDWYPYTKPLKGDIAGELHELLMKKGGQ